MRKGKDISGIEAFKPILQAGQTRQAMTGESAGYGDAGLIGSQGTPEQKAVAARQAQLAQERAKENTGMSAINAIPGLTQAGTNYGAEQAGITNAFNLGQFGTETGMINENSQYIQSPWWGILQGLASNAGKAAAAAAV